MAVSTAYLLLLIVGLGMMLGQLLVSKKRMEHVLFALFCGSMAMVAAQQLSADTLGPYRYLLGLGTCATCNAIWLMSKAMFSGENALHKKHFLFALVIAVLIILHNSINMGYELSTLSLNTYQLLSSALGSIINLLSSTVLALTCWEAVNGLTKQNRQEKWQRILFIASFCFGFTLCTVVAEGLFSPEQRPQVSPWLVVISALQIMLITQLIFWWRLRKPVEATATPTTQIKRVENKQADIDDSLVTGIRLLLLKDKRYLAANLKMIDLANELNVSEYKISRAIRHHFDAPNFNYFVNSLRIEHAKGLLERGDTQHWPIITIALESGFSSLATFNRVFKTQLGYPPNQHRKMTNPANLSEQTHKY